MRERSRLDGIRALANELDEPEAKRLLAAAEATVDRSTFHLAVLGEFKRGKSSLVNAVIGIDTLPTDVLASTAVLTVVEHGEDESCRVTWNDGHSETWPVSREAMDRLTVEGDLVAEDIRHAVITLDVPLLEDGLVLIDTPGVNDLSDARAEVTYGILPHSDAALFLLDATAPLTRSEADFLTAKVLTHKLDSLLFILSKADRLDNDEREEAMNGARSRIKEVLGVEGTVLPYSSLETVRARERGEEAAMHNALLNRIADLRLEANGNREQRVGATLELAAQQLLMKVDTLEALVGAEQEQLLRLQEDLQATESRQQVAFARLKESVNRVGRGALADMMDASLDRFFTDLHRDLDNQLKLQTQQIDRWWKGTLPITLERQLRQYMERKSAEIQAFLDRFIAHTSSEYRKHFDEPLKQDMRKRGVQLPDWQEDVQGDDTDQSKSMVQQSAYYLGGTALGLATTLVFPVAPLIALVGGGLLGRLASVEVGKRQLSVKRQQYKQELADRIGDIHRELQRQVHVRIDAWFDEFLASIDEHRQRKLQALRDDLNTRLRQEKDGDLPDSEALAGMRARITALLEEMKTKERQTHV